MSAILSVFEIIDFKPDPKKITETDGSIWFDCNNLEEHVLKTVQKICQGDEENNFSISLHDAAVFSAYFGLPRDEKKKLQWDNMEFGTKVAEILNILSESGYISFTKIL